jgi:hypothetical protein
MAVNEAVLTLSNSVGLIVDRTITPEQVVGQACLISKSRVAACASSVFNYVEAPWALIVKFPNPDLWYAVKSITLHPDFNKREARTRYLTQTGLATDSVASFENDIASVSMDPTVPELRADQITELNSLLSIGPQATGQDLSGPVEGTDIPSLIQRLVSSGREGLLTFFDERGRPIARLLVRQGVQGYVQRAIYKSLTGELALFEMILRRPRGIYIFQPSAQFTWPNVRDIETPIDKIMAESTKRAGELQQFLGSLGGPDARYVRAVPQFDPNAVHPNARWIVERLWTVLDGYLTLDKLWERIGADTYTALRAIQEMLRLQIVLLERGSPFSCSGSLGVPIAPIPPQEVSPGDQLTGFFLDPLTGRPVLLQGGFQGRSTTNPNTLLHNIQFPPSFQGAMVLKNNQLVGLTSGPFVPAAGQPAPASRLYQMTPIQALSESARKLKSTGSFDITAPEAPPEPVNQDSNLPPIDYQPAPGAKIGRFICPACQALNLESGFCQKCGADLETGQMPPNAGGKSLRGMQQAGGLSKKHLVMGGAALLVIGALVMMFGGQPGGSPPAKTSSTAATGTENGDVQKAVLVATQYAGLKDTAPPGYVFQDASKLTNGALAFELTSELKDQKILFVVLDNTQPYDHLELVAVKVPYSDLPQNDSMKVLKNAPLLDKGPSLWKGLTFNWVLARYKKKDDQTSQMVLIGSYLSPVAGKAMLVIARPIKQDNLDYKTALWLIETMAQPLIDKSAGAEPAAGTATTTGADTATTTGADQAGKPDEQPKSSEAKEATAEELAAYAKKIEDLLKAKYVAPKDKDAAKESVTIVVGVTEEGSLNKIEIEKPSAVESFDKSVEKLVTGEKLPPAPHTKTGSVLISVTAAGAKLTVSLK